MAALVATIALALADPADFEVTSLPGLKTQPSFKHYSGFLPAGDAAGTNLFFWFVESQRDPANDPVVFWTNGGPGSSSVAYGFWTEHGPWRLQRDDAASAPYPVPYNYSYNKIANVLYVEMPAGVGFSYATDAVHYRNITDDTAATDTYAFLLQFFKTFSQFKANPLYITGESYGGHYVPTIATKILDGLPASGLNMKGFLVGNPGINSDWCSKPLSPGHTARHRVD